MGSSTNNNINTLVLGAGGFIGSHLVKRLKSIGKCVVGVDLKEPEFSSTTADSFLIGDLRDPNFCKIVFSRLQFQEVFQLAADMGGAGYIFTGRNDAQILHNSSLINLNVLKACIQNKVDRVFFSSSACVYPKSNQMDSRKPICSENTAYPADPDSEYGWEKLFAERLYAAHSRNYGLKVRIARYHNVFGPEGTYAGGKEKAPAALCRKIAQAFDGNEIEIWGDGNQIRTFLFIDECIEGTLRLMYSNYDAPINIGSEEMISINELAKSIMEISGKNLKIKHIKGPTGVGARRSDNRLIREKLGWSPELPLRSGLQITYKWISNQVKPAT